jgi:hypothetical protein
VDTLIGLSLVIGLSSFDLPIDFSIEVSIITLIASKRSVCVGRTRSPNDQPAANATRIRSQRFNGLCINGLSQCSRPVARILLDRRRNQWSF